MANILPGTLFIFGTILLLSQNPLSTITEFSGGPLILLGFAVLAFFLGETIAILGRLLIPTGIPSKDQINILGYQSVFEDLFEDNLPQNRIEIGLFGQVFRERFGKDFQQASPESVKELCLVSVEDGFKPHTKRIYLLRLFYPHLSAGLLIICISYFVVLLVRFTNEVLLNLLTDPISVSSLQAFGSRSLLELLLLLLLFIGILAAFLYRSTTCERNFERLVILEFVLQNIDILDKQDKGENNSNELKIMESVEDQTNSVEAKQESGYAS